MFAFAWLHGVGLQRYPSAVRPAIAKPVGDRVTKSRVVYKRARFLCLGGSEREFTGGDTNGIDAGTLLADGRYKVVGVLGAGATGVTFSALDTCREPPAPVALKALSLRRMKAWKELELFQRECVTLSSLDFPAIPKYIDVFERDTPDSDKQFFLAQMIAPGESLQLRIERGWRATPAQVRSIFNQLLDVLDYLGSLSPPVVHRDIKPANIIIDIAGGDVKLSLVDFGAVAGNVTPDAPGRGPDTEVGTFGYMAPEQLSGSVDTRTDLYSAGATMLFLVSGTPPSAFPQYRLKINFRQKLLNATSSSELSEVFDLIDEMLNPAPEDRPRSAKDALSILSGARRTSISKSQGMGGFLNRGFGSLSAKKSNETQNPPRLPKGSRILVERNENCLVISIPPSKIDSNVAASGAFAVAWNGIIGSVTISAVASGAVVPLLFTVPFWFAGYQVSKRTLDSVSRTEILELKGNSFGLRRIAYGSEKIIAEGSIEDLSSIGVVIKGFINGIPLTCIQMVEGVQNVEFGNDLSRAESEFICSSVIDFVPHLITKLTDRVAESARSFDREDDDFKDRNW